ncbi:MAG: putative bifunctional diguanylate cyclase/phosphodiesterase [Gemmatimonadaceae bacterium]
MALSVLMGVLASYTALDLAGRVTAASSRFRHAWLVASAVAMGVGIWSTHFIGMLAYRLDTPVSYAAGTVALTVVIAVVSSAAGLAVVSRPVVRLRALVAATLLMGPGFATMHYVGMSAMRTNARLSYDTTLVAVSIVIALTASFAALWLAQRLRSDETRRGRALRGASALLMSVAITGMHYTGMAAARFTAIPGPLPEGGPDGVGLMVQSVGLVTAVAVGTFLVLALALAASVADRWLHALSAESEAIRRAEATLRSSEARFRALVQRSSDVTTILDADGTVRYTSASVERVLGYSPTELVGRRLTDWLHPDDGPRALAFLAAAASSQGDTPPAEWRFQHRDGSWRHVDNAGANLLDDPTVRGIVLNTRDVTERTALEQQLVHQAFHDPLTGLANRALFRDRVEHTLAREERRREGVAVLFLDLDDFKIVNDSLGHGEGDNLLRLVAERLLNATRGCDTVARLGGDEFAILVENARGDDDAVRVAERVQAAFRIPFNLVAKPVVVSASIGIATARPEDGPEELLRSADVAMYRAKSGGQGGYELFVPEMHAAVMDRMELEADLRGALEREEFHIVYQPIVELDGGRVAGAEALVRWEHPTRGLIPPLDFIPLAESTGLIVPLGRWVLAQACRQGASWQEGRGERPPMTLTVNISGRQLERPEFVDEVADALAISGLPPGCLVLEITESVIVQNSRVTLERLHALKALDVRLAIDDFGTGYSSLAYLQQFPVDILKIDKSFVDNVARGGSDAALARTILALGEMLSLHCVAEGVEESAQSDQLRELGCSLGQGYLFARPLHASAMTALLADPATTAVPEGVAAVA